MIVVQLDVFSGRPNPRWRLSSREIRDLVERVTADRSVLLPRNAVTGGLGYRGFIIEHTGEPDAWSRAGLPPAARIGGRGIADAGAAGWLLGTSGSEAASIPQGALEHSQDSIGLRSRPLAPPEPCSDSLYTSDTDFRYWNNAQHQYENNCYNYASNKRTDTFAQPGRGSGHMYTQINCREVGRGALWDGWRGKCVPGHWSSGLLGVTSTGIGCVRTGTGATSPEGPRRGTMTTRGISSPTRRRRTADRTRSSAGISSDGIPRSGSCPKAVSSGRFRACGWEGRG